MADEGTPPPPDPADPVPEAAPSRRFQRLKAVRDSLSAIDQEALGREILDKILNPKFLSKVNQETSLAARFTALFLLPFVIIVSLVVLQAWDEIMTDILSGLTGLGTQGTILSFLATVINLTLLIFTIYFWFQWVRTGGFNAIRL